MHMPTFDQPSSSGASSSVLAVVNYTASGTEGTNFLVPIGSVLATSDYEITWSTKGVASVPVLDFPDGPGDRTTSYFRVYAADVLTEGDRLVFVLHEAS